MPGKVSMPIWTQPVKLTTHLPLQTVGIERCHIYRSLLMRCPDKQRMPTSFSSTQGPLREFVRGIRNKGKSLEQAFDGPRYRENGEVGGVGSRSWGSLPFCTIGVLWRHHCAMAMDTLRKMVAQELFSMKDRDTLMRDSANTCFSA
jgi:hypothetical protein